MRRIVLIGMCIWGIAVSASAYPRQLRYWGKETGVRHGWIELDRQRYFEVEPGTEIPAWGRVKEVTDDRLVLERRRTEAEKRRLAEQGALVHDVLEILIPREDLRRVP